MNSTPASRIPNLLHAGAVCALFLVASIPTRSDARTDCRTALRAQCAEKKLAPKDCNAYVQSEIFKLRAKMEEGSGVPDCSMDPDPKLRPATPAQEKAAASFDKKLNEPTGQ